MTGQVFMRRAFLVPALESRRPPGLPAGGLSSASAAPAGDQEQRYGRSSSNEHQIRESGSCQQIRDLTAFGFRFCPEPPVPFPVVAFDACTSAG